MCLIGLNPEYRNKPTQCYGYDFSRFYVNMMLDIKIPKKPGIICKLEDVNLNN